MPQLRSLLGAAARALSLFCLTQLAAERAHAEPVLPSDDAAMAALRQGYERLEDNFATRENGLFLDPIVDPAALPDLDAFFAQTAESDFQAFTGLHPFEALSAYDEYGDEGNFAGVASVGVAARLLVLRAEGAPDSEVQRARAAAVRAAKAWHVYGAIGGPGVIARGVRRVVPEANEPTIPGVPPVLVALKDAQGNPLPADKVESWRAPVVSGFDEWVWLDDTSKDQVSGYALAVAWLWDALRDDPEVDPQILADLEDDLRAFVAALRQVAPEKGIDLCLRDADGRLTSFHDLNPRSVTPDADPLPEGSPFRNGFNALLALGVVRAAYHVTGDADIGKYYYEELVGRRLMAADPTVTVALMYLGATTNYSNVNMAAIGLLSLGRFETDPYVRQQFDITLETQFWDVDSDRDASTIGQAWFDAIYGAYSTKAPANLRERIRAQLLGFPPPPCVERDRVNCDDAELMAKACLAIDGTTNIVLLDEAGWGGLPVARDVVPMSVRPDSDFAWRSDPHSVNGTAGARIGPRGDWLAAYWLSRLAQLGDPAANLSPNARPALEYTLGEPAGAGGGGNGAGGGGGTAAADEGCACNLASSRRSCGEQQAVLLLVVLAALRRRPRCLDSSNARCCQRGRGGQQ